MNTTSTDLDLGEWLTQTQTRRDELAEYGASPLPLEAGERHMDLEKAIQNGDDAGRLLADIQSFLTQATAQAVLDVRSSFDQLGADERKLLVKNKVRDIQRIADGLAVTQSSIRSRIFSTLNANRSRS